VTNRQLLEAPGEALSAVGRQRRHVLRVELTAMPCPACAAPAGALAAAGVDVNDYAFGAEERSFRCPSCGAALEQVVPFVAIGPAWHRALDRQWLAGRLQRARLYEQLLKEKKGEP